MRKLSSATSESAKYFAICAKSITGKPVGVKGNQLSPYSSSTTLRAHNCQLQLKRLLAKPLTGSKAIVIVIVLAATMLTTAATSFHYWLLVFFN